MSLFEKEIRAAADKALVGVNLTCYKIAWDLFSTVVSKTPSPSNPGPTAEGSLANQWYPSVGSTASSMRGTAKSSSGTDSLSRIRSMINGLEFYDKDGKFTLSNNLDYAVRAESLGWYPPLWKGTPPYRMVALSLQSTLAKYNKVNI